MATLHEQAQARFTAAVDRERREMLRGLRGAEERLGAMRERAAAKLREMFGVGRTRADRERISRAIARELRRTETQREAEMVASMARAAGSGGSASRAAVEAVFGRRAEQVLTIPVPNPQRIAEQMARQPAYTIDGVTLSRRIRAIDRWTAERLSHSLTDSLRRGESTMEAAERMLTADNPRVHLPRYITELRDAVRGGAPTDELVKLARSHRRQVERLVQNPQGIRASGREFLRRVPTASAADVQRQVDFWVMDKARYLEQRVVRTETQRAMQAAFVRDTQEHPWTMGYRWNLSGAHAKLDVCDQYGGQDLHGLGEGGYPTDSVPMMPAHPHCICYLTSIVDDRYFDRELARSTGGAEPPREWESGRRETATEWMQRQPAERRREILGPGRDAAFRREPSRVVRPDGSHAPLWQAEGRRRPAPRTLGEPATLSPEMRARVSERVRGRNGPSGQGGLPPG